ncbi:MAG: hypothetical protein IJZ83_09310 [Clostridia bacterium]|nr:hypothetical protein [Clostridia bacterium]
MKKKVLIIAAIVAAVVLVAVGIIVAVVLNNAYLDRMKGDNFSNSQTYNGVEIVEKDGLFYITKDGKKLSKTGYTFVSDANSYYDDFEPDTLAYNEAGDFELYEYFIVKKPEVSNYFLVNGEGDEIAIKGDNLMFLSAQLPYVAFMDILTEEWAILSLKNLDSDLSDNAGEEIALNYYDYVDFGKLNDGGVQNDYAVTVDNDVATDSPAYSYFNAEGYAMFVSPLDSADDYTVYTTEGDFADLYFRTNDAKLYSFKNGLVATDVMEDVDMIGNTVLVALSIPDDSDKSAEELDEMRAYWIISANSAFKLSNSEYAIDAANVSGNLLWVPMKSEGTVTDDVMLFSMLSGKSSKCTSGVVNQGNYVVVPNDDNSEYTYLDNETGDELLRSKYSDFHWYADGVFASASEYAEKIGSLSGDLPVAYLHFVAPGKSETALTLNFGEVLSKVTVNDDLSVYKITSTDSKTSTDYSIVKSALYIPFASAAKTAAYDSIQIADVFSNGADIAIATDFAGGKYDIIDITTGNVIRKIEAAGADMAKTVISHVATYTLVADEYNRESAVEVAAFAIQKLDDNGDVESSDLIAISRNTAQTEGDFITAPATVMALGSNAIEFAIVTSDWKDYGNAQYELVNATKYFIVNKTNKTADVYKLNDAMALEEVTTIPYLVEEIVSYGDKLDDVYFKTVNDLSLISNPSVGLCDVNGNEILAPVYTNVRVCEGGEYVIVSNDNGVCAMYKYKAKSGKVKMVLDYIFDDIEDAGDGAVIACIGADWYLYEGNDMVKSDRITGEPDGNYNISIDEETGKVMINRYVTYYIDGKLYIHRSEAKEVTCESYYAGYSGIADISESGVKVVNFRDASGSIIETKIVYPTGKSIFEFAMADTGVWYSTGVEELQDASTAVTKEMILASNDSIINVYKGHSSDIGLAG